MGCGGSKASLSLQKAPARPKYKVAIVERAGHIANDPTKDRNGLRYDSIPIANGAAWECCWNKTKTNSDGRYISPEAQKACLHHRGMMLVLPFDHGDLACVPVRLYMQAA